MTECITFVAVLHDKNGVHAAAVLGDIAYIRESLRLSYDALVERQKKQLDDAIVCFSDMQYVVDGVPKYTDRSNHVIKIPFSFFLSDEFTDSYIRKRFKPYLHYSQRLDNIFYEEIKKYVTTR